MTDDFILHVLCVQVTWPCRWHREPQVSSSLQTPVG